MSEDSLFNLKYPIGQYAPPKNILPSHLEAWIKQIESLPERLTNLLSGITEDELNTPYRPDGWTIRQVIHHIPDSHVNSYVRFKWALTEESPTIKAYHEDRWAELSDTKDQSIQVSLDFLKVVHAKLVNILKGLTTEQLKRTFTHPENGKQMSLEFTIGMYAWHGEHHLAHVKSVVNK